MASIHKWCKLLRISTLPCTWRDIPRITMENKAHSEEFFFVANMVRCIYSQTCDIWYVLSILQFGFGSKDTKPLCLDSSFLELCTFLPWPGLLIVKVTTSSAQRKSPLQGNWPVTIILKTQLRALSSRHPSIGQVSCPLPCPTLVQHAFYTEWAFHRAKHATLIACLETAFCGFPSWGKWIPTLSST